MPEKSETKSQRVRRHRLYKLLTSDPNHPSHGTEYGYNAGCRCERCNAARKRGVAARHSKRLAEMRANPDDHAHGTVNGYNYGCRCMRCVKARSDYDHNYYKRANPND